MARATATETADRVELLAGMILIGDPPRLSCLCATNVGGLQSAGLSADQASLASDKLDIDESGVDRQELLSWSIQTVMAAAGQAMQQKNPGAVVACMRQLDHMPGTGYNSHRGNGNR